MALKKVVNVFFLKVLWPSFLVPRGQKKTLHCFLCNGFFVTMSIVQRRVHKLYGFDRIRFLEEMFKACSRGKCSKKVSFFFGTPCILHFYSIINPSIIYNVYNVHVMLILSIKRIRFILSSEHILQAHNYVSKSTWLNWRHFSMLYLLTNSLPSVLMLDKIWLVELKIVCF